LKTGDTGDPRQVGRRKGQALKLELGDRHAGTEEAATATRGGEERAGEAGRGQAKPAAGGGARVAERRVTQVEPATRSGGVGWQQGDGHDEGECRGTSGEPEAGKNNKTGRG